VNILRDQSLTAALAAQPVVQLKAPFDGTVADVSISPGQPLANGSSIVDSTASQSRAPAIRLVATGANSILADVSETDVVQLSPGQKMDVTFPGLPNGETASGTIVEIGAVASATNNKTAYPVRIEMTSPPTAVRFGMTAQASIAVAEAVDVLVAPRRAIRSVGGQTLVDKFDANGQVQAVPVQVGRTFGTSVELLNGVQTGDVVALYEGVTASPRQP
jgi:multidrug efflux pump subunit AcrA (membrane-fusion protein)